MHDFSTWISVDLVLKHFVNRGLSMSRLSSLRRNGFHQMQCPVKLWETYWSQIEQFIMDCTSKEYYLLSKELSQNDGLEVDLSWSVPNNKNIEWNGSFYKLNQRHEGDLFGLYSNGFHIWQDDWDYIPVCLLKLDTADFILRMVDKDRSTIRYTGCLYKIYRVFI